MTKITMHKNEVIEKVSANAEKHKADYEEAKAQYQLKLLETLQTTITKCSNGEKMEYNDLMAAALLPKPHSYYQDYLDALEMLNNHVDDNVELEATDYKNLIKDDWTWKSQFVTTNASYGVGAI